MTNILKENLQDLAKNEASSPEVTTEGTLIAYASLIAMPTISIFYGSLQSNKRVQNLKRCKIRDSPATTVSMKAAAMFPLTASCALIGFYMFFQLFSKECVNLLATLYFFIPGILCFTHLLLPFVSRIVPGNYSALPRGVCTSRSKEIFSMVISSIIFSIYVWNKNWMWLVNNIFAAAYAVFAIENLHVNNLKIGCTLLGGCSLYDAFWVFGSDIRVAITQTCEVPIKLVFPQDLLHGKNVIMLGLGDIVIPGVFIALLLRFDESLKRGQKLYFYSSLIAYIFGLAVTFAIMSVFQHPQPALLYLVPACIGAPIAVAFIKGDVSYLFCYQDYADSET